jgi:hypothetical protein
MREEVERLVGLTGQGVEGMREVVEMLVGGDWTGNGRNKE